MLTIGASTVAQLIAKGKAENKYNNGGISSDAQWMEFFNDALRDLAPDLNIKKPLTIDFVAGTREYDMNEDFFEVLELYESNGAQVKPRRTYGHTQNYGLPGYFLMFRGSKWVMDLFQYTSNQTFSGLYQAYPTALTTTNDKPDVPSVGEMALVYYAIEKALRNQNQVGQAQEMKQLYETERKKIRNAVSKGG